MSDEIIEKDIVLGVMHNEDFIAKLAERGLKGLRFENKIFKWIVVKAMRYWRNPNYGHKRPSKQVLMQMVKDDGKIIADNRPNYI